MPNDFYGLPLHPLIVHATVVIIPTAAVVVLLAALWPRFRQWAGPLPVATSLVGLILVPLSTSTGETLERHVERSAQLREHTHLADGLLPWMIGLTVVASIGYALYWRSAREGSVRRAFTMAVAVLAIAAAAGTAVQVARIGHSGAEAAWADTSMSAAPPSD
ncbi:hypothetical protein C6I20_06120 [Aeromicrobium sp. A1-2]|uniref:DUF2231 domain-containing protein n=1 Tax=Aeromicrobium sp. A1-2 TaxID=2107713 RepID=UPI000E4BA7B5|nr:DUF2231 domain-containing protein [Aeromicrobium sp. A1-2]AXT84809.1 hypothetical protein C6I20_06120 [Aeromicrobium sp. A1-2]